MKNQLKTVVLLGLMSAMVLAVGALLAPSQLYVFAGLALAMNLGAYYFSDRIVLRMHDARELLPSDHPELHGMVADLAARAKLPKPRVYLIPDDQPNAFATGRNPETGVVAVTEGILRVLDRRELRGVLAHELAHIKNRDILVSTLAAAAASLITYAGQALTFGTLFGGSRSTDEDEDESGGNLIGTLVAVFVAPLAASLIQMGISRSREYLADETGAEISGDPEGLASALLKLEQAANLCPGQAAPATASLFVVNPLGAAENLARWFSTHPSTEDRVKRLVAMKWKAQRVLPGRARLARSF